MPSEHKCFLLTPVEFVELSLRRYVSSERGTCAAPPRAKFPGDLFPSSWGYHNASAAIAREPGLLESTRLNSDDLIQTRDDPRIPADDPRWPTHCPCGYAFQPEDERQTNRSRLYRRSDTGEVCTIDAAPVGAMWDAVWYRAFGDRYHRHRPDFCLELRTPAGNWIVDGPSNNGDGWTRTGEPPLVVARPSIGIGDRMHGFLGGPKGDRPGMLTIDKP